MSTVTSSDGSAIAYEKTGDGPPVILVDGALCYRASGPSRPLAEQLSPGFTVYSYDRRGRGDSDGAPALTIEREVDDLAALVKHAGGSVALYGISSGAALALEAARLGLPIERLALYEAPFIVDDSHPPMTQDYVRRIEELAQHNPSGAVSLFMRYVGVPRPAIAMMRMLPVWSKLKGVAHTLPCDTALVAPYSVGQPLPASRWESVTMPVLAISGGKSPTWMRNAMSAVAEALPNGEHRVLEGQNHMVKPAALAPILTAFFNG